MGSSNSKQSENDTINWKDLKTENISSTKSNLKNMNVDAEKLVLNLNYPELSENSEFNIKYLISNNSNLTKNNNLSISENDNNSTSAFISSEMYKYIVDKYQNQTAVAPARVNNQMIGGAKNNYSDDSSTSSTSSSKLSSSSSSSSSETAQEKKERKEKKNKKPIKGGRKTKPPAQNKKKKNSKFTEEDLSYISSSAHTVSEKSISDENSVSISSSVRTSQINLISE
jgi:hypothetical protein